MSKINRIIAIVFACCVLFFATLAAVYLLSRTGVISNLFPTSEPLASFQQFHVISHDLDENDDLNAECELQLGGGVRLADWNDIVAFYEGGGSLDEFIAAVKMSIRDDMRPYFEQVVKTKKPKEVPDAIADEYRISKEGEPRYQTGRHYFVGRHEHIKPPGFLAHDHINNYQLTLGSWRGKGGYALAYGNLMGMSTSTILLIFYGIVLGVTLTIVYILNPRWLFREKTKE